MWPSGGTAGGDVVAADWLPGAAHRPAPAFTSGEDLQLLQAALLARGDEVAAAKAARAAAAREAARRAAAHRAAVLAAERRAQLVAAPAAPAVQRAPAAPAPAARPAGSAQQIAMGMLGSFGWSSSQFSCLDVLWGRESGWNVSAENPGTGAYGIPQADPGSKMASAGPDWQSDAATQIRWGLGYIKSLYGSPCAAWDHEEATGWY